MVIITVTTYISYIKSRYFFTTNSDFLYTANAYNRSGRNWNEQTIATTHSIGKRIMLFKVQITCKSSQSWVVLESVDMQNTFP